MLDDFANHTNLDTAGISRALQGLFSPSVSIAVLDPRLDQGGLMVGEDKAIAHASPKRVREFTAGRVAARMAMVAMGAPIDPIPSNQDRAPIWPMGIVGSISHCSECCVAVVGEATEIAMLGVDVEPYRPLEIDLIDEICTQREQDWLSNQEEGLQTYLGKIIFSAKESAYKCQYPLSRQLIGFEAIEINLDLHSGQFGAVFTMPVAPFQAGDRMIGRFTIINGLILTGMTLGI